MRISSLCRVSTCHGGVLLACLLMIVNSVWAQDIPLPAPLRPIPAPTIVPSGPGHSAAVTVRGPCDPDYWIVSARCCNERLECGLDCQYQVFRFDGPGPGRRGDLQEMYASLEPGVPVCIMVHGSFVLWESVLRDSAATYRWLRKAAPERPVKMIFFSWPSDEAHNMVPHALDTADARRLGHRAEMNSLYLADLVSRVPDHNPISLIGHSHGARMVSATLHLLSGGLVHGRCFKGGPFNNQRIRTVLAAAAMDHDWLNPGERFDRTMWSADCLVNLRNEHDPALLIYPLRRLGSSRALGRSGFTSSDRKELGRASARIAEVDVSDMIGHRHLWPAYLEDASLPQRIRNHLYFADQVSKYQVSSSTSRQ